MQNLKLVNLFLFNINQFLFHLVVMYFDNNKKLLHLIFDK